MYIEFGDSLISTSCIAAFRREEYYSNYYIKVVFNRKVKDEWNCQLKFKTEEEMNEKWNELKTMLCPMKALISDDNVLEKDNPFFVSVDLAKGTPV